MGSADSRRVCVSLQKLEEQDRKALNVKEQLQREHRYLKRRLEQLSVSGSVERIRTDSMGSTISTDSEQGTRLLSEAYCTHSKLHTTASHAAPLHPTDSPGHCSLL